MNGSSAGRLAHIDGLRGVATLLVLYQHLLEYVGRAAPPDSWARLHLDWTLNHLDLGKLGVVLFFAVSGYIVPFSLGGAWPRLSFVLSRLFRLYPAYWLSLAAAALLLPALGSETFAAPQLLANMTMLQTLLGHSDVLGVYWTLLIEWCFYALCLMLFSAGWLHAPRALAAGFGLALGGALLAAMWRSAGHGFAPVGLPLYLAIMLFGTCLRLATVEHDAQAKRCCRLMLPALLLALPLVWATAYDDNSHKQTVAADTTAFCLALLLFVGAVRWRAFALRPLAYAGAISYAVYLFHPLTLELVRHLAAQQPWPASAAVQIGATLLLTWAVAHGVHRGVEQPAIAAGKRLRRWWLGRTAVGHKLPAG